MVTKDEARKFLGNVPEDKKFWINNGPALSSLAELAEAFPKLNQEAFSHHVNKEKNDFSNWIKEVIGDAKLAEEISKAKTKHSALKKLKERLNSLKKRTS